MEHLSVCPLQLVDCELALAGCSEKIQRNNLKKHMKDNVQQHLLCVFTASQSRIKELENQVEEVRREKNQQLEEVRRERDQQVEEVRRERDQQVEEVRRERDQQLEEVRRERDKRDKQVKDKDRAIQDRVTALEKHTGTLRPVEFTVSNYSKKKRKLRFDGPSFYVHPGGVKLLVGTDNRAKYFYVELYQLPGEFDDEITWPVKCTVTVYLLNQLGDYAHISGSKTLTLTRPQKKTYTAEPDPLQLSVEYSTIEDCSKVGIRYLKDDCLKVRVYVELK